MVKKYPSQLELSEIFLYNSNNGRLYWKYSGYGRNMKLPAGYLNSNGYRIIGIDYKLYRSNRLTWIFHNGEIPPNMVVDHIDGNSSNDKIENLQVISQSKNLMKSKPKRNTSGYRGVSWHEPSGKWQVRIYLDNKEKYLGRYEDVNEAAKIYDAAALEYFGEYARLNLKKKE